MDDREQKASGGGFFHNFQSALEAIVEGIWELDSEIALLLVAAPLVILVIYYAFRALFRLGRWVWSVCRSGRVKKAVFRSAESHSARAELAAKPLG
ncbi:hypothetical protein [Rhizobium sp. F40D2]|uniref:hypothetical protein n=1 Tax=Rhizobium sp. F40D2 TaxID=3453141 RepID=UPI003F2663B2